MRSKDLGTIKDLPSSFSKEDSLDIFRKMNTARTFEMNVKKAYDNGLIRFPVYLSVGQESVSAALSMAYKDAHIFGQHRCHDYYLSYGGDMVKLIDELLMRDTGCAHGMGGSASIHSPEIHMFGHSGLLGDHIPIAVGYALGNNKKVLAVMGDATAEEDYVLGALGYAAHKKVPVLFVVMDNNLSVLTEVKVRRNWSITKVAEGFGIPSIDIADDPWLVMHHANQLKNNTPALINVRTVRHLWHFGTGVDGPPEWDRLSLVREELIKLGLEREMNVIEEETNKHVNDLWERQLQKK